MNEPRQNILFMASDNSKTSGAFHSMVKLAAVLQEKYHYKVFVVLPYKGQGQELLDAVGIEHSMVRSFTWTVKIDKKKSMITKCKFGVKFLVNLMAAYMTARIIKKRRIDIVHLNTSWTYVGAFAAKISRKPFVWHIREFLEEDQGRTIINRKWGYSLMDKSNKVVAISESIAGKYIPLMSKNKVSVIWNGIDESRYYVPNHTIMEHSQIQILMVGSISESKGQHQAIQACVKLKKLGIDNFLFLIVGKGDGTYVEELKQTVTETDLKDCVEFCGPTDDTSAYYRNADIFLMCSRAEAFGRVTVEAMMSGCLVIGADSMGTSELLSDGKTGYLYKNQDITDLADKIEYVLNHREEARVVAYAGQMYARVNLTAQKNAKEIHKLYQEILKRGI